MADAAVRHHIVLVPGFVGFDALGQLEYYSGVTDVFAAWSGEAGNPDVALHYFENVPTASVELRAERLCKYLLKKVVRGEFGRNDRVALVGHSTGCLDIRKALYDLASVSASSANGVSVEHERLLACCQRLAFMSAPHFGTTLADAWTDFQHIIRAQAKNAGLALQLNRDYVAAIREKLFQKADKTELELALIDVLNESDERASDSAQRTDEREARAELALWLEHIGRDFQIIEDLRSRGAPQSRSPAHFDAAQRASELARWKSYGVQTRSYATRVSAPVRRDTLVEGILAAMRKARSLEELVAHVNKLARLWAVQPFAALAVAARAASALPFLPLLAAVLHERPALIFELFHAMCADKALPFQRPEELLPELAVFGSTQRVSSAAIDLEHSDGVVNTLSMLWPYDREHPSQHSAVLVEADHGDIIGHYKLRRSAQPKQDGRQFDAYDFFPSGSNFSSKLFEDVWNDVFAFCTSRQGTSS